MADDKTLDLVLRRARTHSDFIDKPVSDEVLRAAHDLMKWGPTSANSQPMRVVYLRSKQSREKLRPALAATNLEKTLKAPLVAIVAYDTRFWEHLAAGRLLPARTARGGTGLRGDVGFRQRQGRRRVQCPPDLRGNLPIGMMAQWTSRKPR